MNYVARDQYGNTFFIDSDHPKKWLMDHFGRRNAQKMYIGEGCGNSKTLSNKLDTSQNPSKIASNGRQRVSQS